MPNVSDKILDGVVTHTVDLLRLASGERKATLDMLQKLERSLQADIENNVGGTGLRNARLKALLQQTKDTIATHYDAIAERNAGVLEKVAQASATKTVKTINAAAGVPLTTVAMSKEQLSSLAGKTLVNGKFPSEWWADQEQALQDKFMRAMREGAARGEGIDELVRRVRGTQAASYTDGIMLASKRQAEALVRTSIMTTANEARIKQIESDLSVVKAIQWVATLDTRTTKICRALDGKQWSLPGYEPIDHDKVFPGPIAHWNCRSTQIAVTRSWKELAGPKAKYKPPGTTEPPKDLSQHFQDVLVEKGMEPEQAKQVLAETRASMDGQVAAQKTFEDWIKPKPDEFQDRVLGPERAKLLRDGKVTITEMTDQNNRPLTIAELMKKVGDVEDKTEPGIVPPLPAATEQRLRDLGATKITPEELGLAHEEAPDGSNEESLQEIDISRIRIGRDKLDPRRLLQLAEKHDFVGKPIKIQGVTIIRATRNPATGHIVVSGDGNHRIAFLKLAGYVGKVFLLLIEAAK